MNRNGSIFQPGAVNIEVTYQPGPLAQPAVVTMPVAGGLKILVLGGQSKVESLAGQIAGHMVGAVLSDEAYFSLSPSKEGDTDGSTLTPLWAGPMPPLETPEHELFNQRVAVRSVSLAEAIIVECDRRNRERQQIQEKSKLCEEQS